MNKLILAALFTAMSIPAAGTDVQADLLAKEFDANPIAAERKYEDKELVVSGIIDQISKGFFGAGFLMFKTSTFLGVTADIGDDDFLATLRKGQPVALKCKGATAGTLGGVTLKDCEKYRGY